MASVRAMAFSSTFAPLRLLGVHAQHARYVLHGAHALELLHLLEVVGQREFVLAQLVGHLGGLFLVEVLLRLLYEGEHVAHAEDASGHAVRVEGLYLVELLADAGELDGLAGQRLDRQRRAARGRHRRAW